MKIWTDAVVGFVWSMQAMRLSHRSVGDSRYLHGEDGCVLAAETIGEEDMKLAMTLVRAGSSHALFLRSIMVWMTIEAPRYWWPQWDRYVFQNDPMTEQLSESSLHLLMKSPVSVEDFEGLHVPQSTIDNLNWARDAGNTAYVKANLPEAYLQTRMVVTNYATLRTAYHQRKNHPLKEWTEVFCPWCRTLPYRGFITQEACCDCS